MGQVMGNLRAGVIGVGHLGRFHALIYGEMQGVDLVGVMDQDEDRAAKVARETGSVAFKDVDALLAEGLDLVSLAVPTIFHAEIGEQILQRRINLLVEKPIAASIGEADRLIAAADRSGCLLQVGQLERFNPAFRSLQPLLKGPRFVEAHRLGVFSARSIDVDVIQDLMIHDLDLMLAMDPSGLKRVDAAGVAILTDKVDIANARLTFNSGCVANLTASRVSAGQVRKFRIFQPDAYFSLDLQARTTRHIYLSFAGGRPEIIQKDVAVADVLPLQEELKAFTQKVRAGSGPGVTGEEGRAALALALEIQSQL